MNADERRQRAAELRAEADALERDEPKEYPKMIVVHGVQKIVNNAKEEADAAGAVVESQAEPVPAVAEPVDDDHDHDDKKKPTLGRKK